MEEELQLIEGETKELVEMYETDYIIDDTMFTEPFEVKKPRGIENRAWWKDSDRVRQLFNAFKAGSNRERACVRAGISIDQYKYFCEKHPQFLVERDRCKEFLMILVEDGLVADAKDPKAKATRMFLAKVLDPEKYISASTTRPELLPPPNAAKRFSAEAFLDEEGNMIVSQQTMEALQKEYGDINGKPETDSSQDTSQ